MWILSNSEVLPMHRSKTAIATQNRLRAFWLLMSLLLLGSTLFAISHTANASDDDDTVKVVYHADFADPRRFSAMLTSINNMITYYQDELVEYDVRIVFNAHGIRYVTDDKLANTPFAEDAALAERRHALPE